MQMMFVISFILVLAVSIGSGARNTAERIESEAGTVARQLTAWHRAAHDKCQSLGAACAGGGGTVDAKDYLPGPLQNSPILVRTPGDEWITTRYDNTTRTLVTHMTAAFEARGSSSLSFATVSAAMRDVGMSGQSSYAGTWGSGGYTPIRYHTQVKSGASALPFTVASPFVGVPIPNGSPVLVGKP